MSPVDKDTISYFFTSLADKVPFPAPGFPNMTILNTFPSLPVFPDSSFALVELRNRLREEVAGGLSLKAAEPQCLDEHCRGDISIRGGRRWLVAKERKRLELLHTSITGECVVYCKHVDGDWKSRA
jgi:hypothetical protein